MTRGRKNLLYLGLIVLVVGAVGVWYWNYWPEYQRKQLRAEAEKAAAARDYARAAELLSKYRKENPNEVDVVLLHAQVLRHLGKQGLARSALNDARKLGLAQKDYGREMALLEAQRNFPQVGGLLLQIADQRPDDVDVLEALAKGCMQTQEFGRAADLYTRLLALQPDQADFLLARADAWREEANFARGAADYREYLQRDPDNFDARLSLADCLLSNAEIAQGEEELLECQRRHPNRHEVLAPLALCALERGDREQAEALMERALQLDSSSGPYWNELGKLFLVANQNERAINAFEQSLKSNPNDRQAHLGLAQALRKRGRKGEEERIKEHEGRYEELERAHEKGMQRHRERRP
jgi:tetratricopeptide (TPR) repeat protein